MRPAHQPKPQLEALSSHVGERLLTRAAELDAVQRAALEVADLRAAAVEAGISPSAFDSALAELRGGDQPPAVHSPRRRPRIRTLLLGGSALILAGAITVTRVVPSPTVPMVEQAFLLRCLPAGEAAELIRPMLEPTSTVVVSPTRAPRVLTVRTTPNHIGEVGAILSQQDGAACDVPATTR